MEVTDETDRDATGDFIIHEWGEVVWVLRTGDRDL
jgi:hypothetical protein